MIKEGFIMKKHMKKLTILLFTALFMVTSIPNTQGIVHTIEVEAHSGRTDSSGGHKDNKNKSGLGWYHYHCGGYPAHLHNNGICPYSTSSSTSRNNSKKSTSLGITKSQVKEVQKKLNKLGYNCGTPDGTIGKKTKEALKRFQKDNGLTVDGIIGKKVLKALGIS